MSSSSSREEEADSDTFLDGPPAKTTSAPSPAHPAPAPEQELCALFTELFEELHLRARRSMAHAGPAHTLQPTALVSEAYVRLQKSGRYQWESREHFLFSAAKVMRTVMVDHFRRKRADKRDHKRADVELDLITQEFEERGVDMERLDLALAKLEAEQPEMAKAVQLRFFAGVEVAEIAKMLGMAKRTLERRLHTVRAWLRAQV